MACRSSPPLSSIRSGAPTMVRLGHDDVMILIMVMGKGVCSGRWDVARDVVVDGQDGEANETDQEDEDDGDLRRRMRVMVVMMMMMMTME
jgi:hypothetical protein